MKNIFISGISSGIGKGLAQYYADKDVKVYGTSRRKLDYQNDNISHVCSDLTNYQDLSKNLDQLFSDAQKLDFAVLNAGILGSMSAMKNADLNEMKQVMETNLWSQKILLDELIRRFPNIIRIVGISSGAAVNGSLGWSGYSLSKAAFNMLINLYASEYSNIHFIALAPGLVDTAMQDDLWKVSEKEFPNLKRIHEARGTENMPAPESFAPKFDKALGFLPNYESGSFLDVRKLAEMN